MCEAIVGRRRLVHDPWGDTKVMIAARNSAVAQSKPEPTPTPSLEAIAELIGVNLESEPELM